MSAPDIPVITSRLPMASRPADAVHALAGFANAPDAAKALLSAMAGNSNFLAQLIRKFPEQLNDVVALGEQASWDALMQSLAMLDLASLTQEQLMRELRLLKGRAALITAAADIAGHWPVMRVTRALSDFAGAAVSLVIRFLLLNGHKRGEFALAERDAPETGSGIIVLGMGKLGGFELNYSSDIDLILLFDADALPYSGTRNKQHFMNRLAQDLVTIMQERTPDGYVFRTDLRLRPDPMSTPPAVNTAAALAYYETVGQNWERAAMIKARPLAGDIAAGEAFMRELIPFVWRKTLDFATIADIHSIKRQMNTGAREIVVAGHNIKTGVGGIREIEFFAATQQLVWGGRIPELRVRSTLEALNALHNFGMISAEILDELTITYYFLRTVEHRLQMRHDAQTHDIPSDPVALREAAIFCGYADADRFTADCHQVLTHVHRLYSDSMGDIAPLAVEGNLVFTGVEADPETLRTLANMGYHDCQRVSDIIQGWHRGHRKSTRSKRSRQVLTELVPALLTALSKTANPDSAFFHFDDFLARLPSGAQIFSLLNSRPELLSLLAGILGSAPALGDTLSNDPALLDSVLESDFFLGLPTKEELENIVTERLRYSHDYEQKMGYLRLFNNEKRFQAGVHLLKHLASPRRVAAFLSDVAEVILQTAMQEVWAAYDAPGKGVGDVPFAVVALGKLGGREMTFGSDLDIIFLYDDAGEAASEARTHMQRISQRLINALTLLTREGRLYEVDTRLRPGGADGPLATSLAAFDAYFSKNAWTYEFMALSRARVVATNQPGFAASVEDAIRRHILAPRDPARLLADLRDMRQRIAREFPTQNPWALKHVRGGMVDLDFIAQYLVLRDAPAHADLWQRSARPAFEHAMNHGLLSEATGQSLIEAKKFQTDLMSLLRLSAPGGAITDDAPEGLKRLLVEGMRVTDFARLRQMLLAMQARVSAAYDAMAAGKLM